MKELDQRARPKGETKGRGAGNAIGKGNRVVEVRERSLFTSFNLSKGVGLVSLIYLSFSLSFQWWLKGEDQDQFKIGSGRREIVYEFHLSHE